HVKLLVSPSAIMIGSLFVVEEGITICVVVLNDIPSQ
ncbi:unnamed protein product, partial [Rotaria sp. Silwood2]